MLERWTLKILDTRNTNISSQCIIEFQKCCHWSSTTLRISTDKNFLSWFHKLCLLIDPTFHLICCLWQWILVSCFLNCINIIFSYRWVPIVLNILMPRWPGKSWTVHFYLAIRGCRENITECVWKYHEGAVSHTFPRNLKWNRCKAMKKYQSVGVSKQRI